jgi:DNA-binding transcriptional MerR regulator
MRIGELSRVTGVPVPTIKYYIREGLLPAGEPTGRNQARYEERHERRLTLVRALVDVGGLSVAATRRVLEQLDRPGITLREALGKTQYALAPQPGPDATEPTGGAEEVDVLLARLDWRVGATNPARRTLAELLRTLRRLGQDDVLAVVDAYAAAAERLAEAEVALVLARPDTESRLQGVVVGSVLGDALLGALRRLAQENVASRMLDG